MKGPFGIIGYWDIILLPDYLVLVFHLIMPILLELLDVMVGFLRKCSNNLGKFGVIIWISWVNRVWGYKVCGLMNLKVIILDSATKILFVTFLINNIILKYSIISSCNSC